MIKGKTVFFLTHETLKAAVQKYFEEETFQDGACPVVDTVEEADFNEKQTHGEFRVTLSERKAAE